MELDRPLYQPMGFQGTNNVDVFVTSDCIHLYMLCIAPQCLLREVSIMYLSHVMPQFSHWEIQ